MMNVEWSERRCSYGAICFRWSEPQIDKRKGQYRSVLRECTPTNRDFPEDRFKKEISIKECDYSVEVFHARIIQEVLQAVQAAKSKEGKPPTLEDYLFLSSKWDDIRKFFGWSLDTASIYQGTLRNVFGSVLLLQKERVRTEDIEMAINKKCLHGTYKSSTIRAWYKIINRIFVYLEAVCPGVHNPVRMNGKKIREAQQVQKEATAKNRISQTALTDHQSYTMLFAFLTDIKRGENLGICGMMMQENGRRPIEAGATTLGMHLSPAGEDFLSAPVYEVDNGKIVDKHKNGRSIRQIPDSPILEQIYVYYRQKVVEKLAADNCNEIDWRAVPFGGKFIYDSVGRLTEIRPYSAKEVSAYVRKKLEECGITFSVVVDNPTEDSNDNRRAYCLRYTALSNLFCFLSRDKYQYIAAHRRSTSETGREDNQGGEKYYLAPQVQRKMYNGMQAADEAVYGSDIVEKIRCFLELDT